MKTVLYVFSGTGNSLMLARQLAGILGNTDILLIPREMSTPQKLTAERIGIIFPVYCWGPPRIVVDFINRLPVYDRYFFAITNFGGSALGTLPQTKELLAQRGITLSGGWGITMPGNYLPLYGAIPLEKQERMFAAAKQRITEIAQTILAQQSQSCESSFSLFNWMGNLGYKLFLPQLKSADRHFWTDAKCNACGLCSKLCPTANVKLTDNKPVWSGNCEQCMACLQYCPQEAIQFKKKSLSRKRYRHPQIQAGDLLAR